MNHKEIEDALQGMTTGTKLKYATVEVTVNRANGTQEDLGIVSGYHRNPLKNLVMQLGIKFRAFKRMHGV